METERTDTCRGTVLSTRSRGTLTCRSNSSAAWPGHGVITCTWVSPT
jgi:hypothetical protein